MSKNLSNSPLASTAGNNTTFKTQDTAHLSSALPPTFILGFNQVAGGGSPVQIPRVFYVQEPWNLTDAELAILKNDFHVNAIRIFIHPAFIGLPQLTWNGPESIRYSSFPASTFVWNRPGGVVDSIDEVIVKLQTYNIMPVFQILPVEEYLGYFNRDDLTFLNNPTNTWGGQPNPLDYTGIKPKDEFKFLAMKLAEHVHSTFGDNFGINFAETGGGGDSCAERIASNEKAKWLEVVQAVKAVAPNALVMSPELFLALWYWAAAAPIYGTPYWGANPLCPIRFREPIPCGSKDQGIWPKGLPLEDYRDVFDLLTAVFS